MTGRANVGSWVVWLGLGLFLGVWGVYADSSVRDVGETELLHFDGKGRAGGRIVVALRAEPKTFNPLLAVDNPSRTVLQRLTADLIHINQASQETEPALARSWTISEDGRRFVIELRRGVRFSDGHPLDIDDVLFTFKVHLDEEMGSPNHGLLQVGGEPIQVRKLDAHRLEVVLAAPYAVGERLFDGLAILPEHRLGEAYREGRFTSSWGLETRPGDIVGLGPFRLKSYLPGERIVLERNPYYWKIDLDGHRLPYLDELVFELVPNEDAQLLRFKAGETHLIDRLSAASFSLLSSDRGGRHAMRDLGPGLSILFMFFNLNDLNGKDLPRIERKQKWFEQLAFRRAVSLAADRRGIVKLVYQGRATPIITSVTAGNKAWFNESLQPPERSLTAARRELREARFVWDEKGRLQDAEGKRVELTLLVNAGNAEQRQIATILQDDLRQLGMEVTIVPLEFRSLIDRVLNSYDYEACVLGLGGGDIDPNAAMDILHSSGRSRLWRLGESSRRAPWEAEIDRLMEQQLAAVDRSQRKVLFDRVQQILAAELPWIFLVSPNVLVGAHPDLGHFRPAILHHSTLWNADQLYWLRGQAEEP